MRVRSLRARVVVTVLALLTAVLAGLFAAVDVALVTRLQAEARTRLTDRAQLAQQLDGTLSPQQLVDRLRGEGVTAQLCPSGSAPADSDTAAACAVSAPAPAPAAPPAAPPALGKARKPAAVPAAAPVRQSGSVLYISTDLDSGGRLTLTTDTTQLTAAVSRLVVLEVAGGLLALAVTGLVLARLAGVALRPLDDMTALARRIAAGDRGRRLGAGAPPPGTELGRTAAAFDAMLDELESALRTAEDAEGRMRAFLGDASHELRTPLAGLQAEAETLLRAGLDRDEREELAVSMIRQTRRAARLVDDLLTVARLDAGDAGGLGLHLQLTDLAAVARQEAARAARQAPDRRVDVVAPDAVVVPADAERIGQVLGNLLDNAVHATAPGGAIRVEVSGGPVASVVVLDDGPGVPAPERERIFERFTRLDASRSRHTGGAGLGLSIARGIARAHGGDLRYEQPVGEGAAFRLVLPAGRQARAAVSPAGSSTSTSTRSS